MSVLINNKLIPRDAINATAIIAAQQFADDRGENVDIEFLPYNGDREIVVDKYLQYKGKINKEIMNSAAANIMAHIWFHHPEYFDGEIPLSCIDIIIETYRINDLLADRMEKIACDMDYTADLSLHISAKYYAMDCKFTIYEDDISQCYNILSYIKYVRWGYNKLPFNPSCVIRENSKLFYTDRILTFRDFVINAELQKIPFNNLIDVFDDNAREYSLDKLRRLFVIAGQKKEIVLHQRGDYVYCGFLQLWHVDNFNREIYDEIYRMKNENTYIKFIDNINLNKCNYL